MATIADTPDQHTPPPSPLHTLLGVLLTCGLLLVHPTASLEAATYYVSTTGNNGTPCTGAGAHLPCQTTPSQLNWDYGDQTTGRLSLDFTPYFVTWTHVVLTSNGTSSKKIYVNGTVAAVGGNAAAPTSTLTGLTLGRWSLDSNLYEWSGSVDDFRLYSVQLSDAEVQTLYRQAVGIGRTRHLIQGGR